MNESGRKKKDPDFELRMYLQSKQDDDPVSEGHSESEKMLSEALYTQGNELEF